MVGIWPAGKCQGRGRWLLLELHPPAALGTERTGSQVQLQSHRGSGHGQDKYSLLKNSAKRREDIDLAFLTLL